MNRNFEEAIREKKSVWTEEYRFKTADGEYRDVFTRTILNYNAAGAVVSLMGATKDITEKRKYEREITKLSFVARYTNNGVIITDNKGNIEWVNDAFTDLTGYTLDEARGKIPNNLLEDEETRALFEPEIKELIRSGHIIHREVLNYKKDGSKFWVRINISPVLENNKIRNFVTIQTDITEIKLQEEKIKKQNLLLRKIAFEAAHNTRRPLANIMGLLGLINEERISHPDHAEVIGLLKNSADELDQMVSGIIKKTTQVEQECCY
jgi:PAS domain S-box-containing protein